MFSVALPILLAGAGGIYLGHIVGDHKIVLLSGIFMILGAVGLGIEGNRYAQKK